MKLFGIDYGRRRVGLAVTDENGDYVRGLNTLDRLKHADYILAICTIIQQESPATIVVGLPLDLDGNDTSMSYEARAFAAEIAKNIDIPLTFVDESLSSVHAAEIMQHKKKKHRRNKEEVDKIAACLILEHYKQEHAGNGSY